MNEARAATQASKGRKVLVQLLLGGLCGGAGMIAALTLLEGRSGARVDPVDAIGIGTALVFGLMGLFVGLGALAPGLGARTLNVEDREELQEQRSTLVIGAVSFMLIAIGLAALTLKGELAAPIAAVATLALIAWSVVYRNKGDEMMRAAAKDAGVITTNLIFLVFGVWAGAAQLGLAPMFEPLLFVAGFFALYLVAVFVAVGRRGLLAPR